MTAQQSPSGFEGPLAEFVALRQEVERRNVVQHALFVLQLTASGAIFSFALSVRSHIGFLIIVPISTYMLCARYVDQQIGSQRAAMYIKDELSGRIPGGLGWEKWQLASEHFVRGSTLRRINSLMIVFPAVATVAVLAASPAAFTDRLPMDTLQRIGFIAIWLLGVAATVMCVQMIWTMLRRPLGDATSLLPLRNAVQAAPVQAVPSAPVVSQNAPPIAAASGGGDPD